MTGDELKKWRDKADLSQTELAEILGSRQKEISINESKEGKPIAKSLLQGIQRLQVLERSGVPAAKWRLRKTEEADFTWERKIFETLWETAPRNAEKIELVCEIKKRKQAEATCRIAISFGDLNLKGRPLYFDHVGGALRFDPATESDEFMPSREGWKVAPGGGSAEFGLTKFQMDTPADLEGKGIGYQIRQRGMIPETRVFLEMPVPFDYRKGDSVGFPLYSDLATRELTVRVVFKGVRVPLKGKAAVAEALTIRRSRFEDEFLASPLGHIELAIKNLAPDVQEIKLGPIPNPWRGFMYAIRWPYLEEI